MTRTRKIALLLCVLLMVGAFFWMRELASWRPQLVGVPAVTMQPSGFQAIYKGPQVKISPDGRLAAVLFYEKSPTAPTFKVWDLEHGKVLFERNWRPDKIEFTPDSRLILVVSPMFPIELWDNVIEARTGKIVRKIPGFGSTLSRDGRAVFSLEGELWRTEIASGKRRLLRDLTSQTWDGEIFDQGRQIMSQDVKGLRFFDARNGQKIGAVPMSGLTNDPGLSPDETIVWSWQGAKDSAIFWKLARGKTRKLYTLPFTSPLEIHFTSDSKFLAVATPQGLEMRDVLTGKLVKTLPGPQQEPFGLSKDGKFAISVDSQGRIWRWRLE